MNIFAELHRLITVASRIERKILAGIFVFGFVLIGPVSVVAQQLTPQPYVDPPKLAEERQATTVLSVKPAGDATECWATGTVKHDGNLVRLNWALELKPNQIRNPGNPSGYMDHVSLRSFGGCLTGPVIEAKPGNTLRIVLTNLLDPNDPSCASNPGCFNTLNMHFHGLHVSPTGNSDNVLINIAPHTKYEYEVNIPEDHPSGTFWYHPHRHESTAIGVASGASGAIIIRGDRPYLGSAPGDIDTILHDASGKRMPEHILLLQQIPYACFNAPGQINQNADGTWKCEANQTGVVDDFDNQLASPTVWDTSGRFTSINGVVQPTLQVPAGEVQRWRFIHAGIHDTVNVQIVPMVADAPMAALALRGIVTGTAKEQAAKVKQLCPTLVPDGNPAVLVPQFEIAADGLTRSAIRSIGVSQKSQSGGIGTNFLQPGYRSDVLVAFPHAGTYCVLNQAATPAERASAGAGGQGPNETQLLATIVVSGGNPVAGDLETFVRQTIYDGNKSDAKLPKAALDGLLRGDLSPWRGMPEEGPASNSGNPRTAKFFIGLLDPNNPKTFGFYINGKQYDPDRIDKDFTMQVNTTEDWILSSQGEPHIFHIHVNPFEIMDVTHNGQSIFGPDGKCLVPPDGVGLENQYCNMWHTFKDTIFVQNDYEVHIRTTYDRYIGEYVMHCHILDHEDSGMMVNVLIVPDASAPGGGLGMAGMKTTSNGTMTHEMHR
ncbi:multicopper oxidase family protein [Afipia sp. GAS231]|uniref:multicopper oxidase family protein n=1 Tax=Afipia sp. GAS231 TaxID=1882747 RepID=UPI00087C20F0|nr:multicopper oxidase domain-containing protein [Afipia sp. GAS231]SDO64969.1 Multicopper oxidase with three cupredoxin domains (includes cell division protein FtsP and spore coat protein CotA) [Afipia sp. GAS231]